MEKVGNQARPVLAQKGATASTPQTQTQPVQSPDAPQSSKQRPAADVFDDDDVRLLQKALLDEKPNGATTVFERARDAVLVYFSSRTNRQIAFIKLGRGSLKVWRFVFTGLRGTPLVGQAINALAVILDTAHATVRTRAYLADEEGVSRADVIADWTRVATDIGGVFDPLIGMAGALGHGAYTATNAARHVSEHREEIREHIDLIRVRLRGDDADEPT